MIIGRVGNLFATIAFILYREDRAPSSLRRRLDYYRHEHRILYLIPRKINIKRRAKHRQTTANMVTRFTMKTFLYDLIG